MVIPKIYPDEYGPGYLMRLSSLNRFDKTNVALATMRNRLQLEKGVMPAQIIAQSLKIAIEEYCQRHTLLPILGGFTNFQDDIEHGSLDNLGVIKQFSHICRNGVYKACKCCVEDDLKRIGVAYFRRSHQMPGVLSCSTHESKLMIMHKQELINLSEIDVNGIKVKSCHQIPILERYRSVLNKLAEFKYPLNRNLIYQSLREKARYKGFNVTGRGSQKLFSAYLKTQLSPEWVMTVFPTSKRRVVKNSLDTIDNMLAGKTMVTRNEVYHLAIAGLHDDCKSATQFLESHLGLG